MKYGTIEEGARVLNAGLPFLTLPLFTAKPCEIPQEFNVERKSI